MCVIDATGRVAREAKVASEPAVLIAWFGSQGFAVTRMGLEAGPLSQWLYAALKEAGFAVELLETRHVCAVLKAMPAPGVGVIVALTFVAAIDDPGRFRSSKQVRAHFGLTPRKCQSGETNVSGRISKIGDGSVRTALYEAANIILTRPASGSALKRWAMAIAKRAGARKAKVALARKLAVVLHRMLMDGTPFAAEAVGRATMAGCGLRGGNTATTAAIGHQPLERSPSPGRWIGSDCIPPSGAPQRATAPS